MGGISRYHNLEGKTKKGKIDHCCFMQEYCWLAKHSFLILGSPSIVMSTNAKQFFFLEISLLLLEPVQENVFLEFDLKSQ